MSDGNSIKKLQEQAEQTKAAQVKAEDLMNKNVITIYDGTKIYLAVQTLANKKISGAPVVDKSHKILGVVSEYDLLLQAATKDLRDPMTYTKQAITVSPETNLKDLIVIFVKSKVRWLPVVAKDQRVVGVVTRLSVLDRLIPKY